MNEKLVGCAHGHFPYGSADVERGRDGVTIKRLGGELEQGTVSMGALVIAALLTCSTRPHGFARVIGVVLCIKTHQRHALASYIIGVG